ncbi:hypothetical protein SAMN05880558_11570 [Aeromonas sp. RU39B]|uniref:DUF2065 domain-containing protein n=1 Tax=Aeromonas sp. RU39B TaxID=1907416 RepID=UPI0009556A9A|nr:DUF2065 domain-containing protein [Aeromonas sp. RU39B]SIR50700.1 hypothetical protein SAMN05880558_11570 [Aeromonas sp. RU39B]
MDAILLGFALLLVFEGLGPLLAPRLWQQLLAQISQLDPQQLRRLGGCLVVSGVVILWMKLHG